MKRSLSTLLFLLPALLMGQGLKMTNVVTTFGEKDRKNSSTLYLSENALRVDHKEGGAEGISTLYKKEEESLYTIDHQSKSYRKITKEDVEQMKRSMEQMRKRMEDMPKEQREQMKEMMGERMEQMSEGPEITYEKTGKTKTIAPWGTCNEYKGVDEDGKMVQKVYTASMDKVTVQEDHFEIFADMVDFIGFLSEDMDKYYPVKTEKKRNRNGLEGFGVLWVYYDSEGKKTQKMRVKEMKEGDIDESRFQVPSGYEGKEMRTGSMGRK